MRYKNGYHDYDNNGNAKRSVRKTKLLIKRSFVSFLAAVLIALAGSSTFNAVVKAQDETENADVRYTYYKSIEIQDGDTLWSLAETYADDHISVADYTKELRDINNLPADGTIHSGQYLTVIYYDREYR